jgi:hypothetical protein
VKWGPDQAARSLDPAFEGSDETNAVLAVFAGEIDF